MDEADRAADEEYNYLIGSHLSQVTATSFKPDEKSNTIFAILDSEDRYACKFVVNQSTGTKTSSKLNDETLTLIKNLVIPKSLVSSDDKVTKEKQEYEIDLKSYDQYPSDDPISLRNGFDVIPKSDDDTVSRMLASDQKAFSRLFGAIKEIIFKLSYSVDLESMSGVSPTLRKSQISVESLYSKQQAWKKIAKGFFSGVRDHGQDFNQLKLDQVPESWKIKVNGRPIPRVDEGVDDEVAEDAICMCCFDGASSDGNRIVFCDGCNSSIHQACYGLSEIPEGDFYCDRCKEVQYAARSVGKTFNRYDAARLVSCCLCPVKHGGIKQTTDGRWAHLCCAVWSGKAVIVDIFEMSPIDVKRVEFQRQMRGGVQTVFDQPCKICNSFGGYVVKCSGCDLDIQCGTVFHPLCAWFEGCYIVTSITDPTFTGKDREQLYPSGLDFKFYCHKHSLPSQSNNRLTQAAYQTIYESRRGQMDLRRKYMMKEEDWACIPGNNRRKHVKKVKKDVGDGSARSARPQQVQEKELTIDVYDTKTCALCLASTEPLIECDTWSKFRCLQVPSKPILPEENLELIPHHDDNMNSTASSNEMPGEFPQSDVSPDANVISSCLHDSADLSDQTKSTSINGNVQSYPVLPSSLASSSSISTSANGHALRKDSQTSNFTVSCRSCHLSVHLSCLKELTQASNSSLQSSWQCSPCQQGLSSISCILCPRRGGFFLNTTEGQWCHFYCSKHCNSSGKLIRGIEEDSSSPQNAILDVRSFKKKDIKQKCNICNRKIGVPISCNFPGCTTYFHALCAERSGRGYVCVRNGAHEYYCGDHIPEGVERVTYRYTTKGGIPSLTRHWVNSMEMQRLRYALVRSLTILDSISRREKHKRLLSKADGEYFSLKLRSQLDKIKGRKNEGISGADIGELFDDTSSEGSIFLGDEAEYTSDHGIDTETLNADSNRGRRKKANRIQQLEPIDEWVPGLQPSSIKGTELYVTVGDDETEIRIGSNWNDGTNISLPNRIFIGIGGYEFDKRETLVEGGYKAFLRIFKERMANVVQSSRAACGIFSTSQQANEFNRKIGPQLLKHMAMPDDEFKQVIAKDGVVYKQEHTNEGEEDVAPKPRIKKAKKPGYVILLDDDDEIEQNNRIHGAFEDSLDGEDSGRRRRSSSTRLRLNADNIVDDNFYREPIRRKRKIAEDIDEDDNHESNSSRRVSSSAVHSSFHNNDKDVTRTKNVDKKLPLEPPPDTPIKKRGRKSNVETISSSEVVFFNPAPNAIVTDYNSRRSAANAAGSYQSKKQLLSSLEANPICKSLINSIPLALNGLSNVDDKSEAIEDIYSISGIPPLDAAANSIDLENEWIIYPDHILPSLERQIQDIIHIIESKQVPDEFETSEMKVEFKKKGRGKRGNCSTPMRLLCEDFIEIPEESFPDYSNFVRHIVTLESLKAQLQNHMFRSMAAFNKSFYEMLNNSRAATPINSKVS